MTTVPDLGNSSGSILMPVDTSLEPILVRPFETTP